MRGQIDKAATNPRHDQAKPKRRNVRQKKIADHSAEERSRFHGGYPAERGCALESGADQKAAEREAFGNFVNAESRKERPFCSIRCGSFPLNSQRQPVSRAVNRQCDNQGSSDFAEMPGGIRVEMTGGAGRANMMHVFADEKEERVPGSQTEERSPPRTRAQTFRQNRKDCYPEKRSGSEADQRVKLPVRQLQCRADPAPDKSEGVGRDDLPESNVIIHYFVLTEALGAMPTKARTRLDWFSQ